MMSILLLQEPKLLPKPSFLAYVSEYARLPGKAHIYATHHLWQTLLLFLVWYTAISYVAVPKIYRQFVSGSRNTYFAVEIPNIVFKPPSQNTNGFIPEPSGTPIPTPTPIPPSLVPLELRIPKLNITAAIEQVGQTKTYEMDVPKNAAHVAWYVYGAKPGEEGNAVINGHYDTPSGKPAVFYKLQTMEEGDEITVISEDGTETTFVVTGKERHPYKTFPDEYVFHTKPGRNLNLITCGGIWNIKEKIYNERVVVYTSLKKL